jgi:hypothetical protein
MWGTRRGWYDLEVLGGDAGGAGCGHGAEVGDEGFGAFGDEELSGVGKSVVPAGAEEEEGVFDGAGGVEDGDHGGAFGVGVGEEGAVGDEDGGDVAHVLGDALGGLGGVFGVGLELEELLHGAVHLGVVLIGAHEGADDALGGVFEVGAVEGSGELFGRSGEGAVEVAEEDGAEKGVAAVVAAVDESLGDAGFGADELDGAGGQGAAGVEKVKRGVEQFVDGSTAAVSSGGLSVGHVKSLVHCGE